MPVLLLASGAVGCAYYNGLYNANQRAKEARTAETEGRRADARSYWLQAAAKAESVVVRYPGSKHHDDALLLQGLALSRVGDCAAALSPLDRAVRATDDAEVDSKARVLLGECHLDLNQLSEAWTVLDPVTVGSDSSVMSRARLLRGLVALGRADPRAALDELQLSVEPEAFRARALALIALNRPEEATTDLAQSLEHGFVEAEWTTALDQLGAADAELASAMVDRLVEDLRLSPGAEARLLIDDGRRLHPSNPERANLRWRAAVEVARNSSESRLAEAHLVIADLRGSPSVDHIEASVARLSALGGDGGRVASLVDPFVAVLANVENALATDSGNDLVLFRRGEEVRDSLRAPGLAANLFVEVARRHPESPIAPKALLAVASLRPDAVDSVIRVLRGQYATSPYTRSVLGLPAPEYEAVEDSIRMLLDQVRK